MKLSGSSLFNFLFFLQSKFFWIFQNELGELFGFSLLDVEIDVETFRLQKGQVADLQELIDKAGRLS